MSILDLLKQNPPTAEQCRETIRRLKDQQAFSAAALAEAESELSAALLAQAEGLTDNAGIAKARKDVAAASLALHEGGIALAAAEQRLDQVEGDDAQRQLTKNRKLIAELSEHRHKLALRFQKNAVELAVLVNQIEEATAEIFQLLPGKTDVTATMTSRADLHQAMRLQLARAGATPWSPGPFSPWELERRADLVSRIEQANEAIGI